MKSEVIQRRKKTEKVWEENYFPDSNEWIRVLCYKPTKSGEKCKRFITGFLGYNGAFSHPTLGDCDLRNDEWRCFQHGEVNRA